MKPIHWIVLVVLLFVLPSAVRGQVIGLDAVRLSFDSEDLEPATGIAAYIKVPVHRHVSLAVRYQYAENGDNGRLQSVITVAQLNTPSEMRGYLACALGVTVSVLELNAFDDTLSPAFYGQVQAGVRPFLSAPLRVIAAVSLDATSFDRVYTGTNPEFREDERIRTASLGVAYEF